MTAKAGLAARRNYFLVSAAVLVVDQATKLLAHGYLRERGPVEVIPNFLNLWYSRNPGGLFGYFRNWGEPWRLMLLTFLPLVAIVLIAGFLARALELDRWTLWGSSLILGGAVGNLVDRLFRGEVIDFLDVYAAPAGLAGWLEGRFGTAHWPTFNVADSAIVVGACLLMISIVRPPRADPTTAGTS